MNNKTELFTFDVETIPSTKTLSPVFEEAVNNKIKRELEYTKEDNTEDVRRRIMGTSPFLGEICVVGYQKNDEPATAIYGDEEQILLNFWNKIKDFNGIFVGFNQLTFDAPFIIRRSMKYGIIPTNKNFLNLKRFSYFPHYDLYMALSDWRQPNLTLSLEQACEFFDIPSSKTGSIKASQVAEAFQQGRIKEIAEYCKRDVQSTRLLFDKVYTFIR